MLSQSQKVITLLIFFCLSNSNIVGQGTSFDEIRLRSWADGWQLRKQHTSHPLLRVVPDAWQGNIDLFSPISGEQVGTLWPHFLMNSHKGGWLTDKVESEGMQLSNFYIHQDSGKIIHFEGTWAFRDLFHTTYNIFCVSTIEATYILVNTNLETFKNIPNVSKIWIELMNQPSNVTSVSWVDAKDERISNRNFTTGPHQHLLGDPVSFFAHSF